MNYTIMPKKNEEVEMNEEDAYNKDPSFKVNFHAWDRTRPGSIYTWRDQQRQPSKFILVLWCMPLTSSIFGQCQEEGLSPFQEQLLTSLLSKKWCKKKDSVKTWLYKRWK